MPDLVVAHPPGQEQERQYVCDVVLRDWLGLDYATRCAERPDVRITVAGDPDARALHLPDVFFPRAAAAWLRPASLPAEPAGAWPVEGGTQALQSPVPILFGEPDRADHSSVPQNGAMRLPIDVFGSIFFLLSRYEEVASATRDRRDRFAGSRIVQPSLRAARAPFGERVSRDPLGQLAAALARAEAPEPKLRRRSELRRGRALFRRRPALAEDGPQPRCGSGQASGSGTGMAPSARQVRGRRRRRAAATRTTLSTS